MAEFSNTTPLLLQSLNVLLANHRFKYKSALLVHYEIEKRSYETGVTANGRLRNGRKDSDAIWDDSACLGSP